ncbi:MAG: ribosome-associated translation inhibitor RaiA [Alphaproteobacteria bacterium]|nr:ribosome-associated translation inhibitor RaiA [Alphaproteobacteria bacterium]MBV9374800.1 ribosome-associated translation inhibitor RaiA [Alphaproteobacteria bacterium]
MQLTVTGKQTEIGEVLRRRIEASLGAILGKYFKTAIEAHAVLSKEAHLNRAEISIHIGRGIVVNAHAAASEAYAAFDAAADRLAKQLRRYKRRLRDHHAKSREPAAVSELSERAIDYVLAPLEDEDEADGGQSERDGFNGGPAVIAEMRTDLPSLTVGEAAMRMDLAEAPVLLFRNRSHGELNLVYRRTDGNIGWIDPELDTTRRIRRTTC